MKFHRVKGEFPVGVVPCIHTSMAAAPPLMSSVKQFFTMFDGDLPLSSRVEKLVSTEPVRLTLEVPEKAATDTARVLRAMADELEGKS